MESLRLTNVVENFVSFQMGYLEDDKYHGSEDHSTKMGFLDPLYVTSLMMHCYSLKSRLALRRSDNTHISGDIVAKSMFAACQTMHSLYSEIPPTPSRLQCCPNPTSLIPISSCCNACNAYSWVSGAIHWARIPEAIMKSIMLDPSRSRDT